VTYSHIPAQPLTLSFSEGEIANGSNPSTLAVCHITFLQLAFLFFLEFQYERDSFFSPPRPFFLLPFLYYLNSSPSISVLVNCSLLSSPSSPRFFPVLHHPLLCFWSPSPARGNVTVE
jgi:hypothetical protein